MKDDEQEDEREDEETPATSARNAAPKSGCDVACAGVER